MRVGQWRWVSGGEEGREGNERKGDAWVGVGVSALSSTHSCGQYK